MSIAYWIWAYAILAAVTTIIGCKVGPNFSRPSVPTPSLWHGPQNNLEIIPAVEQTNELAWWQALNSPELDQIVHRLEHQNFTLAEAASRIQEARAQRRATMTQRLPLFSTDAAYTYRRFSQNGNAFVPQTNALSGFNLLDTGIDLSWELDLWGRVKRLEEAAQADIDRAGELYRDLRIMLIAEACRTFVEARVLQHRLWVAEANIELQAQTLELTGQRRDFGFDSDLDVAQAATQLELTRSNVPDLQSQLYAAVYRLCVLQGDIPDREPLEIIGQGDIPTLPSDVTIGIPCDLLRQRPDVRAAEERVKGDSARIGVAIADLYPQLSINGSVSVNSRVGSSLFTQGSLAHDIGPNLKWNLLQMGRTRASIVAAEHRYHQSLAAYRQTVLEGYEEVENALVQLDATQRAAEMLARAVEHAQEAYRIADFEYRRGNTTYQTLLDTQRQLLMAQDQWAQAQGDSVQAIIQLYRAMGGGWLPGNWFVETPSNADVNEIPAPIQEPVDTETTPLETIDDANSAPAIIEPFFVPEPNIRSAPVVEPLPIEQLTASRTLVRETSPSSSSLSLPAIDFPRAPAAIANEFNPGQSSIVEQFERYGDSPFALPPIIAPLPAAASSPTPWLNESLTTVEPLIPIVEVPMAMQTGEASDQRLPNHPWSRTSPPIGLSNRALELLEEALQATDRSNRGTIQFVPQPTHLAPPRHERASDEVASPEASLPITPESSIASPNVVTSSEASELPTNLPPAAEPVSEPTTSESDQPLPEISRDREAKDAAWNPNIARWTALPLYSQFAPNARYSAPIGSGLVREVAPREVPTTGSGMSSSNATADQSLGDHAIQSTNEFEWAQMFPGLEEQLAAMMASSLLKDNQISLQTGDETKADQSLAQDPATEILDQPETQSNSVIRLAPEFIPQPSANRNPSESLREVRDAQTRVNSPGRLPQSSPSARPLEMMIPPSDMPLPRAASQESLSNPRFDSTTPQISGAIESTITPVLPARR